MEKKDNNISPQSEAAAQHEQNASTEQAAQQANTSSVAQNSAAAHSSVDSAGSAGGSGSGGAVDAAYIAGKQMRDPHSDDRTAGERQFDNAAGRMGKSSLKSSIAGSGGAGAGMGAGGSGAQAAEGAGFAGDPGGATAANATAGGGLSPGAAVSAGVSKMSAMAMNGLKSAFKGFFSAFGKATALGAKFGLSATATGVILGVGATGAGAVGLTSAQVAHQKRVAQMIDDEGDDEDICGPTEAQQAAAFGTEGDEEGGDREEERRATAREIYDILRPMGTSKENIAGILGAWDVESMLDPTTVETIYDEPYRVGPKKKAAEAQGFKAALVAPAYKARFPGVDIMGVGIAQISNSRGKQLFDYARSIGKDWSDLGANIAYFVGHDDPHDKKFFTSMIENTNQGGNSPGDAAEEITRKWERPNLAAANMPKRRSLAEKWFAEMGSWGEGNKTLSDSVLAQAETTVGAAAVNEVAKAAVQCLDSKGSSAGIGNASAAEAMVDYAWPTREQSKYNNGTPLYQYLHDEIFPGDRYYMSCDRSVAVGVRWSDTDSAFPPGPTRSQYTYAMGSDKWEVVNWGGKAANLRPGDILIKGGSGGSGHIIMYLGKELAMSKPGALPGSDMAHGSLGSRSPGIDKFSERYYGSGAFTAFRRTSAPSQPKYKDMPIPADKR